MATKTIKFRSNTDGVTSIADGTDGIVLATATDAGEYPVTISGITTGWVPNNDGAITTDALYGAAAPFEFTGVRVPAEGARRLRIDRTAGTFNVKLQVYMPTGVYASTALRILDADGTTQLFAQTVTNVNTDDAGPPRQINTNGTLVALGTVDAGVSITTTGSCFFIELPGTGSFFNRLTYVEFDTATETPIADTLRFIDGTVPDPIIAGTPYTLEVEAWDSILGVRVTSFTDDITIGIDIAVPVGYIISSGTLTQPAVSGVATFSDIVFSPLSTPPIINSSTRRKLFGSLFV